MLIEAKVCPSLMEAKCPQVHFLPSTVIASARDAGIGAGTPTKAPQRSSLRGSSCEPSPLVGTSSAVASKS